MVKLNERWFSGAKKWCKTGVLEKIKGRQGIRYEVSLRTTGKIF